MPIDVKILFHLYHEYIGRQQMEISAVAHFVKIDFRVTKKKYTVKSAAMRNDLQAKYYGLGRYPISKCCYFLLRLVWRSCHWEQQKKAQFPAVGNTNMAGERNC
jgi:hypothetical protein